jgi:ADP-ribose pyrophosphatase YjhB (NUDIX family)
MPMHMLPDDEFYRSLPKKRMAAGCLFFDAQGRILLVKPTYKPTWEIPGGVVELNESPMACCMREVQEEIGLARSIGDLLVVDYNHPEGQKTESLMFIFSGGVLSPQETDSIRLHSEELSEWRFFAPAALPEEMTPTLRERVLAAWRQAAGEGGVYLEDQLPPRQ